MFTGKGSCDTRATPPCGLVAFSVFFALHNTRSYDRELKVGSHGHDALKKYLEVLNYTFRNVDEKIFGSVFAALCQLQKIWSNIILVLRSIFRAVYHSFRDM